MGESPVRSLGKQTLLKGRNDAEMLPTGGKYAL